MEFFDAIYVVSLPTRQDRRDRIQKELSRFNVNYTIVDAIDGKVATSLKKWYATSRNHISPKYIDTLSAGEIGCILSHIRIWEMICLNCTKDGWYLILEDDCMFDPRVTNEMLAESIQNLPRDCKYFKFTHLHTYKTNVIPHNKHWNKITGSSYSTMCYAFHTSILQSLLNHIFISQIDHLVISDAYVINVNNVYQDIQPEYVMGYIKENDKLHVNYYHGICKSYSDKDSNIVHF